MTSELEHVNQHLDLSGAERLQLPVHMHVVTAEIEGDQELKDGSITRVS